MDKEYPEGGTSSPGGTYSLEDQRKAPSHTGFKSVCIPDLLVHISAQQKNLLLSISLESCQGYMKIYGQIGIPL